MSEPSGAPMSLEQWHEEIDRRLNAARPARYHEGDESWMEPVIEWAAANMPPGLRERALRERDADG
jgi:hypothetical protein